MIVLGVFGLCLLFLVDFLLVCICFHGFFLSGEFFCFGCYLFCLVGLASIISLKFCLSVSFSSFLLPPPPLAVMHGLWALGSLARVRPGLLQ